MGWILITPSKLKEVTSQLTSLQEALKLRSDDQNLHATTDRAGDSRAVTPEVIIGLVKPPSITVDTSHVADQNEGPSFYGIEDPVGSALSLGEQTLGINSIQSRCCRLV